MVSEDSPLGQIWDAAGEFFVLFAICCWLSPLILLALVLAIVVPAIPYIVGGLIAVLLLALALGLLWRLLKFIVSILFTVLVPTFFKALGLVLIFLFVLGPAWVFDRDHAHRRFWCVALLLGLTQRG